MSNVPDSPARIPESVRAIVNLYGEPLADVRFPDVDRELLLAALAEVEQHSAEVQRALATVQAARAQLEASQAELLELARTGFREPVDAPLVDAVRSLSHLDARQVVQRVLSFNQQPSRGGDGDG